MKAEDCTGYLGQDARQSESGSSLRVSATRHSHQPDLDIWGRFTRSVHGRPRSVSILVHTNAAQLTTPARTRIDSCSDQLLRVIQREESSSTRTRVADKTE